MDLNSPRVTIRLRIPGNWPNPQEFIESMPAGFQLTPDSLVSPDGHSIALDLMDADDQFPEIFRSSCRQPPEAEELAVVERYTVNVVLSGSGGSASAALAMMRAGAAIVQAGGAGVFIDNCGLSHGGSLWTEMSEDGGADALSYAYVGIVRGEQDVWTVGMHALGLRDIVMRRSDLKTGEGDVVEVIRYLCRGDKRVDEGHVVADPLGPRFQVAATEGDEMNPDSVMHNPYGRWKLVSIKDIAESN